MIRVNILKREPTKREPVIEHTRILPVPVSAIQAGEQRACYALVRKFDFYDEDLEGNRSVKTVVQISMDPAIPVGLAKALNAFMENKAERLARKFKNVLASNKMIDELSLWSEREKVVHRECVEFCRTMRIWHPEAQHIVKFLADLEGYQKYSLTYNLTEIPLIHHLGPIEDTENSEDYQDLLKPNHALTK